MATAAVQPARAQQQRGPERQQQPQHRPIAELDRRHPQQADAQGHQQQEQARHGVEPVQRSLQIGQPLAPAQPPQPQRPLAQPQGLQGAGGPALPLAHEIEHGFSRQAGAELLAQVAELPAPGRQGHAGNQVFRDGLLHKAADLVEGRAAHHKAGAGAHHRPPGAAHRLDPAVEALLIRQQPALQAKVAHHRIGIETVLGRLHQRHLGLQQQTDGALEKVLLGHEIGIEHRHQLPLAQGQAGVEIAGLGMEPLGSVVVAAAVGRGQGSHLRPVDVIQHPEGAVLVVQAAAAQQAPLQHRQRFAAGGNQHIHPGSPAAGLPAGLGPIGFDTAIAEAAPGQQ